MISLRSLGVRKSNGAFFYLTGTIFKLSFLGEESAMEVNMDKNKFEYLYMKLQGAEKDSILKEVGLSEAAYNQLEVEMESALAHLIKERAKYPTPGADFVQRSSYLYDSTSDQAKGFPRPNAIQPIEGELIPLPPIDSIQKPFMSISEAIEKRRSLRDYAEIPLTQEELSYLLWATQWIRDFRSSEKMEIGFRNVPSAGCRHPFETYLLINHVKGIKPGIYYYHPLQHGLILYLAEKDLKEKAMEACFSQLVVASSAVTFFWVAFPYRTAWRYGQRGYRYIYIDAGHVGQNLHLAAEAIHGGACMVGAYNDEAMNELLSLNGKDAFVIYIASVGKKK